MSTRRGLPDYDQASWLSQSAAAAAAFYKQVAESRRVWTIRDDRGFPAPADSLGQKAQPLWSSRSRAQRIIDGVPAYEGFAVHEVSWEKFRDRWLPGLQGANWMQRYRVSLGYRTSGEPFPPRKSFPS